MSRMILVICTFGMLTFASGCSSVFGLHELSIVQARIETLGPNRTPKRGRCSGCEDCIPCRPFDKGYTPEWDYHVTEHTAHKCAFRALREYRKECGRPPSHHFKLGFISAYEDLALNRKPRPRVVPPPRYWNAFYRSCEGRTYVEDWFNGYDAGLAMGMNSGVSRFSEIYLRRCGGPNSGACAAGVQQVGMFDQPAQFDAVDPAGAPPAAPTAQPQTPVPMLSPYGTQGRY